MRSRRLPLVAILVAILLACVVGRGVYVLHLAHTNGIETTVGDTPTYLGPAQQLLEHGRFDSGSPPGQPEFLRTPGYPTFIAAVYRVFGENDNTAVLLVQVVLSALTVLLAYLLAARMWSKPIGLLAALLVALDPLQNTGRVNAAHREPRSAAAAGGGRHRIRRVQSGPAPTVALGVARPRDRGGDARTTGHVLPAAPGRRAAARSVRTTSRPMAGSHEDDGRVSGAAGGPARRVAVAQSRARRLVADQRDRSQEPLHVPRRGRGRSGVGHQPRGGPAPRTRRVRSAREREPGVVLRPDVPSRQAHPHCPPRRRDHRLPRRAVERALDRAGKITRVCRARFERRTRSWFPPSSRWSRSTHSACTAWCSSHGAGETSWPMPSWRASRSTSCSRAPARKRSVAGANGSERRSCRSSFSSPHEAARQSSVECATADGSRPLTSQPAAAAISGSPSTSTARCASGTCCSGWSSSR